MNHVTRDDRQVMAFGKEGQDKIRALRVGIVGLGGLGSHMVQQLAYLGVRDFLLVDPDSVGTENLNRIIGSKPSDVGQKKVLIAERMIREIAGDEPVGVSPIAEDIRSGKALTGLYVCDSIFGCVDRDGPRLVLNEIAISKGVPYFDSAFGLTVENGRIVEAGGRVVLVAPGGPCLLCCKEIDMDEARYDLAKEPEREFAVDHGYVSGAEVPQPSVVSLDGIIASVAVTEFLAFFTEFRAPVQYTCYDMLKNELRPVQNKILDDCMHHMFRKNTLKDILRYCN